MFVWWWVVVLALGRASLPPAGTPPPPLPRDPVGLDGGTFVMGTEPARVDALCPAAGPGPHVGFRCARSTIR